MDIVSRVISTSVVWKEADLNTAAGAKSPSHTWAMSHSGRLGMALWRPPKYEKGTWFSPLWPRKMFAVRPPFAGHPLSPLRWFRISFGIGYAPVLASAKSKLSLLGIVYRRRNESGFMYARMPPVSLHNYASASIENLRRWCRRQMIPHRVHSKHSLGRIYGDRLGNKRGSMRAVWSPALLFRASPSEKDSVSRIHTILYPSHTNH